MSFYSNPKEASEEGAKQGKRVYALMSDEIDKESDDPEELAAAHLDQMADAHEGPFSSEAFEEDEENSFREAFVEAFCEAHDESTGEAANA